MKANFSRIWWVRLYSWVLRKAKRVIAEEVSSGPTSPPGELEKRA
jgi:hypothetical protein